jgi:hypothetical protein
MTVNSSGTVGQTYFETRKVVERAFGLTRLPPEKITAEYIEIAQDFLYMWLSTLASKGIALWAIQKVILPIYDAVQSVPCPLGTVDVLNANLRTANRLQGTYSASEGTAANAFDGNLTTACTQTDPGGYIEINYGSPTAAQIYGILPNTTATWDFQIQTSADGATWTTILDVTDQDVIDGQWLWYDIQGIGEAGTQYCRLLAASNTVLDVIEFVQQNLPEEIPLAKINRDDYANLPDKWQNPGRPVIFWYDKQIDQPILTIWPPPSSAFQLNQYVLYVQQYVQDVGSLTQQLAVPQRWLLAVVYQLGMHLARVIPEVQPGVADSLAMEAEKQLQIAWASETDSSPTFLRPRLWSYTR